MLTVVSQPIKTGGFVINFSVFIYLGRGEAVQREGRGRAVQRAEGKLYAHSAHRGRAVCVQAEAELCRLCTQAEGKLCGRRQRQSCVHRQRQSCVRRQRQSCVRVDRGEAVCTYAHTDAEIGHFAHVNRHFQFFEILDFSYLWPSVLPETKFNFFN